MELNRAQDDGVNRGASSSQWRHQESRLFHQHAPRHLGQHGQSPIIPRDAELHGEIGDLANFPNSSRISPDHRKGSGVASTRDQPLMGTAQVRDRPGNDGRDTATEDHHTGKAAPNAQIACGPLLNYRRMEGNGWIGSVLVVTQGGGKRQSIAPILQLRKVGKDHGHGATGIVDGVNRSRDQTAEGICLYSDRRNTFWRFDLRVQMEDKETQWDYELPGLRFASETKPQVNTFFVPAIDESMRIMFHSCNGFSVGTDEAAWSGPALWKDVMRRHRETPFHVMIGGGDQIYNDGIRVSGPLRTWTDMANPKKRREYPFPEKLREECDDYYLKNYIRWYATAPFDGANGQIPQLNIWDDHDIIDGFGSYVNEFMRCAVFRGIGGTAHKYYMLFQHHLPPPRSTFTSDAVPTVSAEADQGVDPNQLMDTFVHPAMTESNYILGSRPGPYVAEHSHSVWTRLGARIAFLGIDARTERTRHQVNYPETYDLIFDRVRQELTAAASSGRPLRHLILLLGVPIAYPRLTWLENILSSPLMGPIKFMNRRFGLAGGFINYFDGSVDLLDDLDDHYTARTHKKERNRLIGRLQGLCADFSLRITILGGDVHLAALGRFYSKTKLNVPIESDYRYMVNIVSSAICNKPPPQAIANLLARRNKIHHLNHDTDETLLNLFDKDPGDSSKTANFNHVTMPSRNYALITENSPNQAATSNGHGQINRLSITKPKDGHQPIHAGEVGAGTKHKAASPTSHGKGVDGSLDVCIRVEIDQHNPGGITEGYGLTIPTLDYTRSKPPSAMAPPRTASSHLPAQP